MDIVVRIVTLPFFILVVFFTVYLPGHFITHLVYPTLRGSGRFLVDNILGIVTVTVLYMIAGFISLPIFYIVPSLVLSVLGLSSWRKQVNLKSLKAIKVHYVLMLIFLFGIFTTGWFMFRGGIVTERGVYNAGPSYHDSLWHVSLIAELKRQFPPQIPTIAGESLKNYHYFSDVTTAAVSFLLPYDIRHLYFFHIPLLISILVELSVSVATKKIIQDTIARYVAVSLTFFAGSFAYVLPLIFGSNFFWHESSFWVSVQVYGQRGKPCRRCENSIQKIYLGGRGTYFCHNCQK